MKTSMRYAHQRSSERPRWFTWIVALASCMISSTDAAERGAIHSPPPARSHGIRFTHAAVLSPIDTSGPHKLFGATLTNSGFRTDEIIAFEDNAAFTFLFGRASATNGSVRLARRLVLLKPSTFVIEDQLTGLPRRSRAEWSIRPSEAPNVSRRQIRATEHGSEWSLQSLLPGDGTVEIRPGALRPDGGSDFNLAIRAGTASGKVRFVNVFDVRPTNGIRLPPKCDVRETTESVELAVRSGSRRVHLLLRDAEKATSSIEVADEQQMLVPRRLLPSGVLPHGPEGVQLLDRWDGAYRDGKRPPWDTGRPSSELKKAVESGAIRRGRAAELGCGTGTSSVYLASRGFEVTGVDIAPTALKLAEEKAKQAGQPVRWMLADVLAIPKIEPVDFVFDRGCYHGVRGQNAAAYVNSLRQITRRGSRVLILAGNADEPPPHYGPPRVTEAEIRSDFAQDFDIEWLREIRFDTAEGDAKGALAWSILLRRKTSR